VQSSGGTPEMAFLGDGDECRVHAKGALIPGGGPLSHVPHCDSDDARAPSDRELARGGRLAYAPDATGRDYWRFLLLVPSESKTGDRAG
jgi:hypothetical protein